MPGVLAFHWPCGLTLRPAHPTSPLSVCQRHRTGQRQRRGRHCRETQRGQTAFPALPSGLPHGYALPATSRKIPPLQEDTQAEPLRARRGARSSRARPTMAGVPQLPAHPAAPLWNTRWPMEPAGYAVTTHQRRKHSQCFASVSQCAGAQILVSAGFASPRLKTALIVAPVTHPRCGHRLRRPSGLHKAPI